MAWTNSMKKAHSLRVLGIKTVGCVGCWINF